MNTFLKWLGVAAAVGVGLAACGGGGGDGNAVATAAPASVDTSTIDNFLAYQKAASAVETIDPATLQKQLAVPSDTAEPTPVTP